VLARPYLGVVAASILENLPRVTALVSLPMGDSKCAIAGHLFEGLGLTRFAHVDRNEYKQP